MSLSNNWSGVKACKALVLHSSYQSSPKYMCIQSPSLDVRIILYESVLAKKLIRTIEIDSNQTFCVKEGIVYDLSLTWNMMVYIDKQSIPFPDDLSIIVIGDHRYCQSYDNPHTTKISPLKLQGIPSNQWPTAVFDNYYKDSVIDWIK